MPKDIGVYRAFARTLENKILQLQQKEPDGDAPQGGKYRSWSLHNVGVAAGLSSGTVSSVLKALDDDVNPRDVSQPRVETVQRLVNFMRSRGIAWEYADALKEAGYDPSETGVVESDAVVPVVESSPSVEAKVSIPVLDAERVAQFGLTDAARISNRLAASGMVAFANLAGQDGWWTVTCTTDWREIRMASGDRPVVAQEKPGAVPVYTTAAEVRHKPGARILGVVVEYSRPVNIGVDMEPTIFGE